METSVDYKGRPKLKSILFSISQCEMDQLRQIIEEKIEERLASGNDDAFYIFDLEDVKRKYNKWMETIPRVVPFYAVKCNDDDRILKTLAEMGAGFDCASMKEVEQILELGVEPERIIYAHTVKQVSFLKFAAEKNVKKVTFDSPEELLKIKEFHPNAEVVCRIKFDAVSSLVRLGLKFGCDPVSEAPELIRMCKELNMNLIGISFHVGSGTLDFGVYEGALKAVRELFNFASEIGFKLDFVDIGGGIMGNDIKLLDKYAMSINAGIDKYFSDTSITIISEPGRYFVESAFSLATQVVLKKTVADGHIYYYINDGIFLSFLMIHISDEKVDFEVISQTTGKPDAKPRLSTIWGSSCNSKDKVIDSRTIPELEIGDWLVFHNMGAYTTTTSTKFNGFNVGEVLQIS